jgi:tetratricopeptide (TPR) repeat protein
MVGTLCACQSRAEKFYHQAMKKVEQRQFLDAVDLLESSAELEKNNRIWSKTNFEIARILRFEIQDYNKALLVYRELILKSEDASIRLLSQEAIAEIYFENVQDYTTAVKEFLLLESLIKEASKLERIRLKIAQCYRYTGSLKTALEYIDVFINSAKEEKNAFLKLKAQIYSSLGQYDEALKYYNQIQAKDPTYFLNDNLYVAVAMVYEEKQDYKNAMAYLTQNKNKIKDQSFVDLRLKRLNEKLVNKPGSRGIRK